MANWNKFSALQSVLAPTSKSKVLLTIFGIKVAIAGLEIPLSLPSLKVAKDILAPLWPAETTASTFFLLIN